MKKTPLTFIAFLFATFPFAQSQVNYMKNPLVEIHFLLNDFKTAELIKNISPGSIFNQNEWSSAKEMNAGIGVDYSCGLNNHIDFYANMDACFLSYTFKNNSAPTNAILLESDAGLNIKLLNDKYIVVPFVNTGAGFSFYQKYFGIFVPLGAGFQFNLNKANIFIFTNAQYKFALTADAHSHFNYSLGIGLPL